MSTALVCRCGHQPATHLSTGPCMRMNPMCPCLAWDLAEQTAVPDHDDRWHDLVAERDGLRAEVGRFRARVELDALADLEALPVKSVVIDRWDRAWQRVEDGWAMANENPLHGPEDSDGLWRREPIAVLWCPPSPGEQQ